MRMPPNVLIFNPKALSTPAVIRVAFALCPLLFSTPLVMGAEEMDTATARFEHLVNQQWKTVFDDPCTGDWKKDWFLDGEHASVTDTPRGMEFAAGSKVGVDADHAVLLTKQSFKGNLRIDYQYTRTDRAFRYVTILYIQASGAGPKPYVEDISKWSSLRRVPAMKTYFNHMNTYHISYAAFNIDNNDPADDYVRARRYMPDAGKGLRGTALSPSYEKTGLFQPGVTYQITVIKWDKALYMRVEGRGEHRLFSWDASAFPPIIEGRIGLRHMYTRSARYRNFRVSTLHASR